VILEIGLHQETPTKTQQTGNLIAADEIAAAGAVARMTACQPGLIMPCSLTRALASAFRQPLGA